MFLTKNIQILIQYGDSNRICFLWPKKTLDLKAVLDLEVFWGGFVQCVQIGAQIGEGQAE